MSTPIASLTVVLEESSLTVTRPGNTLSVTSSGPQGPAGSPGPAGAPGGSAYEHTQASAASVWNVAHNLGRRSHVTVLDADGMEIETDVTHASANVVVVTFPSPQTGVVIVS